MRRFCPIIFLLLPIVALCEAADSTKIDLLISSGMANEKTGDFRQSIENYLAAVEIAKERGDTGRQLRATVLLANAYFQNAEYQTGISVATIGIEVAKKKGFRKSEDQLDAALGENYVTISNFEKALFHFDKSRKYRKTLGENTISYATSLNDLANAYYRLGRIEDAKDLLSEGLEIMDSIGAEADVKKVYLLHTMGAVSYFYGQYKDMLSYNERALSICLRVLGENDLLTAHSYQNMGLSYSNLNELNISNQYHQKSIEIRERIVGKKYWKLIQDYLSICVNYIAQENGVKTMEYAKKAYDISIHNFGEIHPSTIAALSNIGVAHGLNGDTRKAIEMHENVPELATKLYGEKHAEVAVYYHILGNSYYSNGQLQKADDYFQKTIDIREALWNAHGKLAHVYSNMAWSKYYQGDFDAALKFANKSLEKSNVNTPNLDDLEWPKLSGYVSFLPLVYGFQIKTFTLYRLASLRPDSSALYFESALNGARLMDSLMMDQQSKLALSDDQLWFASKSHEFADYALYEAYTLHEKTKDRKYQDMLFYLNERAKSNILLAQTLGNKAASFAGIPEEVLTQEVELQKTIESAKNEYLQGRMQNGSPDSSTVRLQNKLFQKQSNYLAFKKELKADYPKYHQLKYENTPVTLKEVQSYLAGLNSSTAIAEYFVREPNIYLSLITADSVKTFNIEFDQSYMMLARVLDFRKSILDVSDSAFLHHSDKLYDLLVRPIVPLLADKKVTDLIVIPDGELSYVPFEILSDTTHQKYLFEDYSIRYANSATLLLQQPSLRQGANLLSFAPQFGNASDSDPIRNNLRAIPGSLLEVSSLSSILRNTTFTNEEASETNFKENSSAFNLIHLATHAVIDENSPDEAKLIFSNAADTINDGDLYPHEIYNLQLSAQLVTLSACNTAFGKIRKGEGVMSLSRAFAYAGVPATVVSLWPASDKSTPDLMKYFYQNLKGGQAKDVALNNARKQYLSTAKGKARHPFYWGGFVLIGDNSPIEEDSNFPRWAIFSVFVIAIVLALYWKKRQTKIS